MTTQQTIEAATSWMERMASDNSHGYSQVHRWGPDYDCSSAVITAWQTNGVPVKTKGATYTGNILGAFKKCGFKDVTAEVSLKTGKGLQRGDVLLNIKHHVAMYSGNGKEVEASIDERGTVVGKLTGDQTGKEFLVRNYRNYPWDKVLRFVGTGNDTVTPPSASTNKPVAGKTYKDASAKFGKKFRVSCSSLMLRSDGKKNASIIGVLHKGDTITWYGYYKYDTEGNTWLYVATGKGTGYACKKEGNRTYLSALSK